MQTLPLPMRGAAIVVLDDDTVEYGTEEKDEFYCYRYFSDKMPPEMISHGQIASLIAIENPSNLPERAIWTILLAFNGDDGVLIFPFCEDHHK